MNKLDACKKWVDGFNTISQSLIERAFKNDIDNWIELTIPSDDRVHESWLPMWGWLWTFGESLDEEWARDNVDLISECGIRIFEDDVTGDIYLGIDGAGYDFYEAHWLKLYEARGLHWHEK